MTLSAGARLGPYEVLAPLGAGGMGEVWRARDTRLDRDVAIKVLPEEFLEDAERRGRFEREAKLLAAVNHPNIAIVYSFEEISGRHLLVEELLEGESLRDVGFPLPPKKSVEYAIQIAQGLSAAHEKGIVHRDLKPGNLFVTRGGRIKILDFGVARLTQPSPVLSADTGARTEAKTEPGVVLGTVGYMAPEQARGQPADPRSDIFAFGCVLYEMLAGIRAFGGSSSSEVLASLLRDAPGPISGVPPGLMRVVERCLAKDPAARYQSASDLAATLASYQDVGAAQPASVAVLPLANLGGGPQDDYFCEGLAETIIGALTDVAGLRVIARTSAFAVARQGLDAREIGARLDVAHVLEGSVQRAGARVRVNVRLVRAADGSDVWSERYDHESSDVFALQDTISAAIARRLRGEGGGGWIGRSRRAVDPEARQAYLEGRYHFIRGGPAGLARARACFERALERDSAFALAYDSLAEVYWFFGFFGVMAPREAFAQSTWHALRALELDDSLGETHALLGMLRKELDYNWPEVHREMRRALELSSSSPAVRLRNAISCLLPLGRLEEAEAEVKRALDVDPLSIDARWWLACTYWLARQPERAAEIGRGMVELDPMSFWGHLALAAGLADSGLPDTAVVEMERASELSGGASLSLAFLGQFQGRAGQRREALATLERLRQSAAGGYLPPFSVALIRIGLGEWDEAFAWMDRAIDERDPIIMPIKSFPFLDPVRSDPRYAALLRRMNLA